LKPRVSRETLETMTPPHLYSSSTFLRRHALGRAEEKVLLGNVPSRYTRLSASAFRNGKKTICGYGQTKWMFCRTLLQRNMHFPCEITNTHGGVGVCFISKNLIRGLGKFLSVFGEHLRY